MSPHHKRMIIPAGLTMLSVVAAGLVRLLTIVLISSATKRNVEDLGPPSWMQADWKLRAVTPVEHAGKNEHPGNAEPAPPPAR